MHALSMKNLTIFLIPTGLIMATIWFFPQVAMLPSGKLALLPSAPYLIIAMGLLLSLYFHRGRPFFMFLVLSAVYWSFQGHLRGAPAGIAATVLFQSACVLVPLNIAIFSLMRERGIVTVAGRLRFTFLGLQALFVGWAVEPGHVAVQQFLACRFTENQILAGLILPQPALPVIALGGIVVAARAIKSQSPIDAGLLGVMAAFTVACNGIATDHLTPVFMTTAAAILTLGVLKDSYNMAFKDDLTGLPSRRALNEQLTWLGRRYTVAMVDVDHFKWFNDTYGHDVGDQVLRMVASKLRSVGSGGKTYRYGGEEFAILFPRKGRDEIIESLEELRRTIADYQMRLRSSDRPNSPKEGKKLRHGSSRGNSTVSVTVSIGVSENNGDRRHPSDVIKAADQALYRAKGSGRNRVCS
ncbi:diguanylate cyclase [Geobacter benzoatilyticus]|uniref:diguanylate cyclase n=2 Tax=Geobacter benzoatilyticus TaxID=2815309 RepID=A0ABX7Q3B9_9BACT|nr:diguanylate cyclase [Geobacter benzoatilyticus]